MGICKCRKRTDLFCFVHKKAVCESCICTDHQVCVVKSYFDWLSEPEYEQPSCGVCKGELNSDNMVRFLCLDMFHPECIDVYASSLPANTALAGITCPTCDKPILPTSGNTSVLAQQIKTTFANSSWANRVLGNTDDDGNIDLQSPVENDKEDNHFTKSHSPTNSNSSPPDSHYNHNSPDIQTKETHNRDPLDPLSYHPPPQSYPASTTITIDQPSSSSLHGMASHRKATKPLSSSGAPYPMDDEDEDKYRKKGLMQLFAALGLVSTSLDGKRGGLDPKILTLIFAGFATIIVIVFLYYVFSDSDSITVEDDTLTE